MRRQVGIWRELALLGIALCGACDSKKPAPGVSETWDNVCVDMDKDGYGFQCEDGDDCDDANKDVHEDCSSCRTPSEGCACDDGIEPIDCRLPYSVDTSGSLLCHTGTRYCRDGVWSGCEGVITFTVSPPGRRLKSALLDPSAPPIDCNRDCDPGCHLVEDKLETPFSSDAGVGTNVNSGDAGGVTISLVTAGSTFPEQLDSAECAANDMPDCDGLPSPYDPDASVPSGGGSHKVAFFDLAVGTERTKYFQANTAVDALDVYMYPGTGSGMDAAIPAIAQALTRGNFLPDGGAGINCLDTDEDTVPDQANLDGGIAGNMSCLVRDVRFGAGWFREIPFYGTSVYPFGAWDTEMFEHRHDISADAGAVANTIAGFKVRQSLNKPEAAVQGLWSIATGQGAYVGWDRPGLPARTDCPAGSFGYPCFRNEALSAVLLISPAPLHNGPMTGPRNTTPATPEGCLGDALLTPLLWCPPLKYPAYLLDDLKEGTGAAYRTLTTSAESRANPEPVGRIDDVFVTYLGDVAKLQADHSYTDLPMEDCSAWDRGDESGKDAVFRFSVTNPDTYFFSGRGSRFDNTLALFRISGSSLSLMECSDDDVNFYQGDRGIAPEIEMILTAGEYLLVMKAFDRDSNSGLFQVTMGRKEFPLERSAVFPAKEWSAADGGVEQALRAQGVRVATLQVGDDSYLREQAEKVALATGAVDGQGAPLVGHPLEKRNALGAPVSPVDFSPLGSEAVRVLRSIVAGTVMDVSLDVVEFQKTNPGFGLVVEAIDQSGDGCAGVADSDDADTLPDIHLDCTASAKPQFRMTLSNPASGSVGPSTEPNGGYFMWMRVLGDQRVLLDRVRVYAVPTQVFTPMVTAEYHASGTYEQEVRANACAANEVPMWGAFSWNANLPEGTSMRFSACASETQEELSACELKEAFRLTPGAVGCTPGSACAEAGYCDATGTCVEIEGASCTENEDCGAFGVCAGTAGNKHCGNTRATLDPYPLARTALQGRRFMRVSVRLDSSPDNAQAPTLLQWSINYHCVLRE